MKSNAVAGASKFVSTSPPPHSSAPVGTTFLELFKISGTNLLNKPAAESTIEFLLEVDAGEAAVTEFLLEDTGEA